MGLSPAEMSPPTRARTTSYDAPHLSNSPPPRSSSSSSSSVPSTPSFSYPRSPPSPSPSTFSPRYALARRRRECLGLLESLRLSMGLSVKAITLLFCCVMMTLQYRAQQKQRTTTDSPPHPSTSSSTSSSSPFQSIFSAATFYSTLHIPTTATPAQVKAAHRRLAIRYHPDKLIAAQSQSSSSPSAASSSPSQEPPHERFIAIQEAYEVLSDPYERRRYDFALMTRTSYHRLSQSMRAERRAAADEKQPQQRGGTDFSAFSALYRRKRPAAFTPTGSGYKGGDGSSTSASTASSAASSAAATPPPASATSFRPSRSFSSLLFTDSPAPTTGGNSSRTSSPHSNHSPATSPYTPRSPSSLSSNPPSTSHSPAHPPPRPTTSSPSHFASLASLIRPFSSLAAVLLVRWCAVAVWMFLCLPIRLLLALSIVAKHHLRRAREGELREEEVRRRGGGCSGVEGSRLMEATAVS